MEHKVQIDPKANGGRVEKEFSGLKILDNDLTKVPLSGVTKHSGSQNQPPNNTLLYISGISRDAGPACIARLRFLLLRYWHHFIIQGLPH